MSLVWPLHILMWKKPENYSRLLSTFGRNETYNLVHQLNYMARENYGGGDIYKPELDALYGTPDGWRISNQKQTESIAQPSLSKQTKKIEAITPRTRTGSGIIKRPKAKRKARAAALLRQKQTDKDTLG